MNDQRPFWVAFNHVTGIGAVRTKLLLERFGTLELAWNANLQDLRMLGIPEKTIQAFSEFRETHNPEDIINSIQARNISVILSIDEVYPPLLRNIDNPPPVLYVVGNLPTADQPMIAIVGTRRMTAYGEMMTRELASYLASNGVAIVSGLARGVDGTAHGTVVNADGTTVAVLGSGVDVIYPPEHRNLAKAIIKKGAVVSEYAPGTKPDRTNFPQRNRIISGMSSAVIVVEAGEKSGSLITARFAAEQGREVFVVPGNYNAPQSRGANRLIRDGARPLFEKSELLEFIASDLSRTSVSYPKAHQLTFERPEEQTIVELITLEPKHINEIARQTGIPLSQLSPMLIMLELKGFITEIEPQTYQRKKDLY